MDVFGLYMCVFDVSCVFLFFSLLNRSFFSIYLSNFFLSIFFSFFFLLN